MKESYMMQQYLKLYLKDGKEIIRNVKELPGIHPTGFQKADNFLMEKLFWEICFPDVSVKNLSSLFCAEVSGAATIILVK